MDKKSMKEILNTTRCFCGSPGFYAGRGENTSDLNYKILTDINKSIKKIYGKEASKNFVKMVASMEECTATDFINNCYTLERNDFVWTGTTYQSRGGMTIDKNEDGSHNMAQGFAAIMSAMTTGNSALTPYIRNRFLHENGIQVDPELYNGSNYYYATNDTGDKSNKPKKK